MADYNFLMESRLTPEQFQVVSHFSRLTYAQGLNLYLVGGAVRDLTYGQQAVRDLDFAVEGNPQRIIRALRSGKAPPTTGYANGTHKQPGLEVERAESDKLRNSWELTFANGVRAEIGMSRSEVYTKAGRRPEVAPAMIFDDLKRRDFSINAMAISLHPNSRGLLLDPTNGAADIEKHEIRVLNSRAFSEDPSRIYRLVRLGLRLDFKPDERTSRLVEYALENKYWEAMFPEQQGRELRAILLEDNPGRVLKALSDRGLLEGLDKKLGSTKIPQERLEKIRLVARIIPGADPYLLNFYALVEKLSKEQRQRLAKKILNDKKLAKAALALEQEARKLARTLSSSKAERPSQVFSLLANKPKPLLLFLLVYYAQPRIQSRVKNYLLKYEPAHARLPRAELQALGMPQGPKFERVLERIFADQLDGKIKTHQQLLKEMRQLSGIKPAEEAAVARRPRRHAKKRLKTRA